MAIDWTKPIETVPDALNPEPVRCDVEWAPEGQTAGQVRFLAPFKDSTRPGEFLSEAPWLYHEDGKRLNAWLPDLRNVAEGASTEDTLHPDAPPVVQSEAPILLRYHLAQAAMLYEVVDEDTPVGDLVRGLGEPAREAAMTWLAAMLAFYDKLDAEEIRE